MRVTDLARLTQRTRANEARIRRSGKFVFAFSAMAEICRLIAGPWTMLGPQLSRVLGASSIREDVMKFRMVMVTGLVLAWMCAAVAQQPRGRIDLGRFAEELSGLVSVRATFEEGPEVCPEDRTLLTISNGGLSQLRHNPSPPARWRRLEQKTIDDETYRYQYGTDDCRFGLLVRMQAFRDGSWSSLLVSRLRKPSLSAEDRKRALEEFWESGRRRSESLSPEERKERLDRFLELGRMGWSMGRLSTTRLGVGFEGAPPNCFQAVGEFDLSSKGLALSFPTNLPGDLNRFVIERADVDQYHARLYLVRDDCRFELSISKSVLHGDQWAAVPLAAIPPSRGQQREVPPEKL
jgi:hypothetical protein